jgi:RsiW-degrading membrane proteinase PrsW (M82 family)
MANKIYILRDSSTLGPYALTDAVSFFERGLLFEHDLAYEAGSSSTTAKALLAVFKNNHMAPKTSSVWKQLVNIVQKEHEILFPWKRLLSAQWISDKQIVALMAIGCVPLLLVVISSNVLSYLGLAAYFSVLWGLFFFLVFKTPQSNSRDAVRVFFQTPLLALIVVTLAERIPPWSILYHWAKEGTLLLRWLGMFFAVGIIEESCKAAPVFFLARKPGRILQPKTIMLYGMISGLGFGIWEGVQYQMGVNRNQGIDGAYFLNMLRLTSLPFIHAVWAGLSGYFIGFSMLHGNKRWALRVLAILVPAVLHATYNTFPGMIGLLIAVSSVVLLMSYLGAGQQIHANMKKGGAGVP